MTLKKYTGAIFARIGFKYQDEISIYKILDSFIKWKNNTICAIEFLTDLFILKSKQQEILFYEIKSSDIKKKDLENFKHKINEIKNEKIIPIFITGKNKKYEFENIQVEFYDINQINDYLYEILRKYFKLDKNINKNILDRFIQYLTEILIDIDKLKKNLIDLNNIECSKIHISNYLLSKDFKYSLLFENKKSLDKKIVNKISIDPIFIDNKSENINSLDDLICQLNMSIKS